MLLISIVPYFLQAVTREEALELYEDMVLGRVF
jgi:hypothetical protein